MIDSGMHMAKNDSHAILHYIFEGGVVCYEGNLHWFHVECATRCCGIPYGNHSVGSHGIPTCLAIGAHGTSDFSRFSYSPPTRGTHPREDTTTREGERERASYYKCNIQGKSCLSECVAEGVRYPLKSIEYCSLKLYSTFRYNLTPVRNICSAEKCSE